MATVPQWIEGARPRTLPAAIAPVVIGTGAAAALGRPSAGAAILALVVSICLQIGVNYANDYSDGIRGTDHARIGPIRLVGQQLASPEDVKLMAMCWFGFAALAGLALSALANTYWILLLGVAAIVAAWFYTGGKRPYGYMGLGEVFVFIFFGLVAVLGTQFTQALALSPAGWAGAVGCGSLSCAILMVNNIRDIPGDSVSGKRTLAVRLGEKRARIAFVLMILLALGCAVTAGTFHRGALAAVVSFALAVRPVFRVLKGAKGPALISVLGSIGQLTLAYGMLLGLGMWLAPTPLS